ncbi:hypothetical protein [Periweissella fabalis]|uniref:Uncharacterized protein n=1 Tax=Periweissella fabalis TaxID=1070421 RepID=A0A7X6N1Q4_9LACO|nr:hypothetical protein [Periweissella fabalis]MCM0598484.1 hypothetical protein [Periweissella fabalis]NKZ24236.1 hypothetical protein [Periweissella fabalis]
MRLHDFINSTTGIYPDSKLFVSFEKNLIPLTHLVITNDYLSLQSIPQHTTLTLSQFILKTKQLPINYRITFQNNLTSELINLWGYRIVQENHQLILH